MEVLRLYVNVVVHALCLGVELEGGAVTLTLTVHLCLHWDLTSDEAPLALLVVHLKG